MTKLFKTLALATAFAAAPTVALAQTVPPATIVIVNMDEVLNNSVAGKQAQVELNARLEALRARVSAATTKFNAEEQELLRTQPAPTAAPAVSNPWKAKVTDLQRRKVAEQDALGKADQDLGRSRQNVLRQFGDAANPIVSAIMKERGAAIALAEGATIQHIAGIDITDDVLARFNKSTPRISTATPAATAAPTPAPAK
ncbi:OmpH family outer membrane protein [Glacieibacterium sp.]|uniref:OmpH family outer membrane protein n=1 Tax=Glacieibacterium sp. TaxID=2860237 RepID=UPI003AFF6FB6